MNLQKNRRDPRNPTFSIHGPKRVGPALGPPIFLQNQILYAGCIRQKLFEENEVLFKILGFSRAF